MGESPVCSNARASLEGIRSLKRDFDAAFDAATASGKEADLEKAQALGLRLETEIRNLTEQVASAEAERLLDLRRQYDSQTNILRRTGLIEARSETDVSGAEREVLFMRGIDGAEYLLPSYEDVAARLVEGRELVEAKAEQGFTKLQLVPFGMSLDAMVERLKAYLLANKGRVPQFDASKPALDEATPVWVWDKYKEADENGTLLYDPQEFSASSGGKTKADILRESRERGDVSAGWRILLLQAGENGKGVNRIPRAGRGVLRGAKYPRQDIEAGKSPRQYLEAQRETSAKQDSPYRGESGMTPEEWIVAFMTHFEETFDANTGKSGLMDEYVNGTDSIAYLTGAYFPASDYVPYACWRCDLRRADLCGYGPDIVDVSIGVRSAVRM